MQIYFDDGDKMFISVKYGTKQEQLRDVCRLLDMVDAKEIDENFPEPTVFLPERIEN